METEFPLSPSGSVRRCVRTQAVRARSLGFRTLRPSWISVICLEKRRDLSLGPMTLFQRAHLRFYSAALVVPWGRLPGHAPVAADLDNYGDPERSQSRGGPMQADHCVLWRRYDHIQGLPIPLPQQISCGRSIVGAVSQKARDRGIQLIQEAG